jgi:hypothetical protein
MEALINQFFEIEKKSLEHQLPHFERNFNRIHHEFTEMGYKIVNPLGQPYDERDTALEASLMHPGAKKITKVLKPIIYREEANGYVLIQKGVVIVE